MKFKIKVIVMQDGSSRYCPMVKTHWWGSWKFVDRWGIIGREEWSDTEKGALDALIHAKSELDSKTLARTYDIPYKEKEQQ